MTEHEYILGAMHYARAALGDPDAREPDVDPSTWEAVKWLLRAEASLRNLAHGGRWTCGNHESDRPEERG